MSRSESPSITQFFMPQRKRPRGGKDDVLLSASKKLLLEEGVMTSPGGGSKEDAASNKPVPIAVEKPATPILKAAKTERTKKAASKPRKTTKTSKASSSSGEGKLTAFVKSTKPSSTESAEPLQQIKAETAEKVQEAASLPPEEVQTESDKAQEDAPPPPTPVETENVSELADKQKEANLPPASPLKVSSSEPTTSKGVSSPVKFLKVGSLSPAKKKKMTSEQVAKLLKRKTNLKDLKSALEGINQCAQKLSDFRRTVAESTASPVKAQAAEKPSVPLPSSASKSLKGVSPAHFYSPTPADRLKTDLEKLSATKNSSPSKLININNKIKKRLFDEQGSPYQPKEDKIPAYQRFHNLAQKTSAEKGSTASEDEIDLPLPYHFKVLKELFMAVETVVGIMKGRRENILFPKLRNAVTELFKKITLREKHLAQMVTVLPNCYQFDLQKVGNEYHIRVNVDEMIPSVVCTRRKEFHSNLIKICLEHHQKFLVGLVPPIVVPSDKQITRWHPQFKLDEIPDIIPIENVLPAKPAAEKVTSAREMIAKAQNILENANPRMKQAVKNMLNSPEAQSSLIAPPKPKSAATVKALKGVSASLLEKIRNREREKLLNEMTRSPAESKKLQMAKRLPNFIKIIRNMMVAEKKVALPMGTIVSRVSHSVQNMNEVDTEAHLRMLTTLLPSWAKIHKLSHSDVEYFKIDKNTDINHLLLEMDDVIKKLAS